MDISVERSDSEVTRTGLFSAVIQTVLGIANRLIGFFTLSDEEQQLAGIYLGGQGRDE